MSGAPNTNSFSGRIGSSLPPADDGKLVAGKIAASKERILKEWEIRARAMIPAARDQETSELINSLPAFLSGLSETLSSASPKAELEAHGDHFAAEHGRDRARTEGYPLDQTLHEYDVLREVLFDILEEDLDLSRQSRDIIHAAIHLATRNSARRFIAVRNGERDSFVEALRKSHEELEQKVVARTTELMKSEERFTRLVEGVKDYAIFTLDPKGYITTWNKGAERMKEYTVAEAVGSHFSMLYPQEGNLRDEPCRHLEIAAKEGRFRGEGMRVKKSGELFLADVLITPMYEDGKLHGFSKVVADLTERNQLIQERDLSRTRLEEMKMERTDRERFVAMLTHDLRNPLTAAKAGAQMILRYPDKLDQHVALAMRVVENINRADKMVGDLLDANRIRAGEELPLHIEACDLNKICEEVCEELSTIHGDRFKIQAPRTIMGHWSRDAIRRILENLLTNAVKYGDVTEPVTVRLDPKKDRVFILVHNHGAVISPEDQQSLFDPFRRAKSAERGVKKGWGLGLTLVRGLADAHGGMVKVESYQVEGTTFTVDLPIDARKIEGPSLSEPGDYERRIP
jgi:PAS domain S-box-containing protein